jgi:charged multivesicular body protein 6
LIMGGALSSSSTAGAKSKSKPPGGTISSVDRAVLDLKNARDRLSRYKRKLELDEARLVARAKQAKEAGQTKNALNLLRLRRYKQREVETVEGQFLNVMQMVGVIDSKQNEAQVLDALKQGKDTLQKMHEQITVDDVLELMDQVQEQNEMEKEISDILQQGVPQLSMEDEEAVEAELEQLMQQEEATKLPVAPSIKLPNLLPTAPTTKLEAAADTNSIADKRLAVPS